MAQIDQAGIEDIMDKLYEEQVESITQEFDGFPKLENKCVMVAGAAGMIGKSLIDVLACCNRLYQRNISVVAVGRDQKKGRERLEEYWEEDFMQFWEWDVKNPVTGNLWRCGKKNVDYIIHGASKTHPLSYAKYPVDTIMTNILGTQNLLEYSSRQENCRFVFLSSVEIYGESSGEKYIFSEKDCGYIDCNSLRAGYSEGKRCGEALCQAYRSEKNLDVVIPRLSRVYGPTMQDSDSKAVAQFIKKAVSQQDIVLKSAGNQLYSYSYVLDAVSGILTVLSKGKDGEAYNISGEDSEATLYEIARKLSKICKVNIVFELPDENEKKGYSASTKALLDYGKLKELGWKGLWNISRGLSDTVEIMGSR